MASNKQRSTKKVMVVCDQCREGDHWNCGGTTKDGTKCFCENFGHKEGP